MTNQLGPIMLVDDDPFALKVLAHQLRQVGQTDVATAACGREALEALDHTPTCALLFVDLHMPGMDGIELIRHLATRQFRGALVLVSGEDQRVLESAIRLARGHGLNVPGHLAKPVRNAALTALLSRLGRGGPATPGQSRATYGAEEMSRAIRENELVNFYQPKVNLSNGALVGVEALVRWRHPVDGLVFPDQFIATAEAHGLIDALTAVVLAGALEQARRWREAGLVLNVAVNISMDNLNRLDFVDLVLDEIDRNRIADHQLTLEVTESRLTSNILTPMEILTRLRLKRVCLSIDDFGTGHSSLAQLRDLPFDELKIDRGFVHRALQDRTRRAILVASLAMSKQLNMKSVGEGVEDPYDWDFLRNQGCSVAQGYLVGKPMPADELSTWQLAWEERRVALTQ